MKFKYIGGLPAKDLDLVIFGVLEPDEVIKNGKIIDIPDDNDILIQRLQINGNYMVYNEPKKLSKPKQQKKNKEEKEEK